MPSFTDQLGRTITLDHPPLRIISLVPSQTELLYTLGLTTEVVGITKFCIHPTDWFRTKPRVGGTKNVSPEKIAELTPLVWQPPPPCTGLFPTAFALKMRPLRRLKPQSASMEFVDPFFSTASSGDNKPSRKKPIFPVTDPLRQYLKHHGREVRLPVSYRDLQQHITYSLPLKDKHQQDTLWETVLYDMRHWDFIREGLVQMYAILKTEGDFSYTKHLDVARIDYCSFANSNPFRIRIVNKFNDNYDHYYIKQADASRIYGLELEHLLSPNRITYFTHLNTLVEEHIPGIPGDLFIKNFVNDPQTNQIRLSKEFVKFNERCFVRLLGDMRSYNFVVDITPDIEDYQYRIRAIDFDQQSYEGRKNLYIPQFFKENRPFVELCIKHLNQDSIEQYQTEERTMMAFRVASSRFRLMELLNIMSRNDGLSTPDKLLQLKTELADNFKNPAFLKCRSMGQVVKRQLKQTLQKNLSFLQKNLSKFED